MTKWTIDERARREIKDLQKRVSALSNKVQELTDILEKVAAMSAAIYPPPPTTDWVPSNRIDQQG